MLEKDDTFPAETPSQKDEDATRLERRARTGRVNRLADLREDYEHIFLYCGFFRGVEELQASSRWTPAYKASVALLPDD